MSAFACGRCEGCESGDHQKCTRPRGTGGPTEVELLRAEVERLKGELKSAYDCIDVMRKVPGVSTLLAKAAVEWLVRR